jgi:hypothetical protein
MVHFPHIPAILVALVALHNSYFVCSIGDAAKYNYQNKKNIDKELRYFST